MSAQRIRTYVAVQVLVQTCWGATNALAFWVTLTAAFLATVSVSHIKVSTEKVHNTF